MTTDEAREIIKDFEAEVKSGKLHAFYQCERAARAYRIVELEDELREAVR